MVDIKIDGKPLSVAPGTMIIEASDAAGIYIPRFCYHKKLSIAANCRMCLVEVDKVKKPMPACSTPVTDGMEIFTKSPMAVKSQRMVMEFLLINHPLDCPICDQGGQCELQDLSMGFGASVSEYAEPRRSVPDEDIGPLIETEMTRCIHCTRCVRFGEEIAGIPELGLTARGETARIGTYIEKSLISEVSGNVIDLCPVGALTSKPFRYQARAWELQQHPSIALHDSMGSNVWVHTRESTVMRVLPRESEALNETWVSDRDRFSYLGLAHQNRLTMPKLKVRGQWQEVTWPYALNWFAQRLKDTAAEDDSPQIGWLSHPSLSMEALYMQKKLGQALGCKHFDTRIRQMDFSAGVEVDTASLGMAFAQVSSLKTLVLIGCDLWQEQPVWATRIRQAALRDLSVYSIHPKELDLRMPTAHWLSSLDDMILQLAGVARALFNRGISASPEVERLLGSVEALAQHDALASALLEGNGHLVLGAFAHSHPSFAQLQYWARVVSTLSSAGLGYLPWGANARGAHLLDYYPQGAEGLDASAICGESLKGYVLSGVVPGLDVACSQSLTRSLDHADWVVCLSGFWEPELDRADLVLPVAQFGEYGGHVVNAQGDVQHFDAIVSPPGQAKPEWKIYRVLGELLEKPGFDQTHAQAVFEECAQHLTEEVNPSHYQAPGLVPHHQRLMCMGTWPGYRIDSLVRHSEPLQVSAANVLPGVYMHPNTCEALYLRADRDVSVSQGEVEIRLPLRVDASMAEYTVWIPVGFAETSGLAAVNGPVKVFQGS